MRVRVRVPGIIKQLIHRKRPNMGLTNQLGSRYSATEQLGRPEYAGFIPKSRLYEQLERTGAALNDKGLNVTRMKVGHHFIQKILLG
jgi:hypothetical protein